MFYRDAQELINSVYGIGVCAGLGWWADSSYDKSPLFLVIGVLVGLFFAGYSVYRFLKKTEAANQAKKVVK